MISIGDFELNNEQLLNCAFTHRSCSKNNYERLEFLGDSILDFLVADILFGDSQLNESSLTRLRSNIVSEQSLANTFDELDLLKYVKLGKSCPEITKSIKGDIVESLIACIYLEHGLESCKNFIKHYINFNIDDIKDEKSLFQEYAQKNKLNFEYVLTKTEGTAHHLMFYISLVVNGKVISSAQGHNKTEAEKKCAKIALDLIKTTKLLNIF